MVEVNGQWYQVYHRSSNINGKRQAMAEPFNITFDGSGNPSIEQVEMTSQGFEIDGLDPFKAQYAGDACYTLPESGPQFVTQNNRTGDDPRNFDPNATRDDWYPVQNIQDRTWLGYKYFNFGSGVGAGEKLKLSLTLTESLAGRVKIYSNDPKVNFGDTAKEKTLIGTINLDGVNSDIHTVEGYVDETNLIGKKGIYLEFRSYDSGEICQINKLQFKVEEAVVPVTDITGVSASVAVNSDLTLTGAAAPANATNKTIAWSVKNAGGTGATISGDVFKATSPGTAVVTATIENGKAVGTAYTQDFNITVNPQSEPVVPVTNITDVPATVTVDDDLTLTGTVAPANATNKTIAWSVKTAGDTGATISGNVFKATSPGTAVVTATIENGKAEGTAYTQDFSITVNAVDLAGPTQITVTVADKTWTGKQIKGGFAISATYKVNGNNVTKALTAGTDYTVTKYGANKAVGKGTVTIQGKGAFKGTKTLTFKIVPKKPAKLALTAGKKSIKVTFNRVSAAQKITTYKVQYRVKGAAKWISKTVKVKGSKKTASVTLTNLKSKKTYQVRVYAYKGSYAGLPTSAKSAKAK
jgi:hypothetical protein